MSGRGGAMADLLVVIPCLNEGAHLADLLDHVVAEAPGARIVVADGGSTDRSRDIVAARSARNPDILLLDNPDRIQGAGVNRAVRLHGAGRRWLLRIDAHCDYPRGFIAGLLTAARDHGAGSVVVPMLTAGGGCFQFATAVAQNTVLGTGGSAHRHIGEGRYVDHGHHALMALADFCAAGGYSENFPHNEDAELDLRLAAGGTRIWLEPSLAITYFPRTSPAALFRQYFQYGSGRARTVKRHRSNLKTRQAVPLLVAPALLAACAAPLSLAAAFPAAVWASASLGAGVGLAVRHRSLCSAASGFAAMIMHAAWSFGYWQQWLFGADPGPPPRALTSERAG